MKKSNEKRDLNKLLIFFYWVIMSRETSDLQILFSWHETTFSVLQSTKTITRTIFFKFSQIITSCRAFLYTILIFSFWKMEYKKHKYTHTGLNIWRNLEIKVGNCESCCKLVAAIDQKREEMKESGRREMFILISTSA